MYNLMTSFFSRYTATCTNMRNKETSQPSTAKMEFAVNMTCASCERAVRESLKHFEGIESIEIDIPKQRVVINTTQPSNVIQNAIEETGLLAVLRGQGKAAHLGAAVSILKDSDYVIKGLVRFTQIEKDKCIVDGSFNGVPQGGYGLYIHEYGDLSDGSHSTGDVYNPRDSCQGDNTNKHVGDLGGIMADTDGSAVIRYEDNMIKVHDIIGRAVVLHERKDAETTGIAYGIIARSAGLFQNEKKVCTCTGKTIWEERDEFRTSQTT